MLDKLGKLVSGVLYMYWFLSSILVKKIKNNIQLDSLNAIL